MSRLRSRPTTAPSGALAAAPGAPPRRPTPSAGAPLPQRGSNQLGLRQFNERVVLQAIRLHGAVPRAELARLTRLTPQTVQTIIARLEADGLVSRLAPVRGRIGQPSVPIALNPDGAFSIGIEIGRRHLDLLLLDFTGRLRERRSLDYAFPDPDQVFAEIDAGLRHLAASLPPATRPRLQGVGVAAPLSLGGWQSVLGIAAQQAARWSGIDIRARVAGLTTLPVAFVKDTAAACVAELFAGRGGQIESFLHVFVDTFIGGGLVIDSQLRGGNAGAIGSLPLGLPRDARHAAPPEQLLGRASLLGLEARYAKAGLDTGAAADARALQAPWWPHTEAWLRDAAPAIAFALHTSVCVLDLGNVVIDGAFSRELLRALLTAVQHALDRFSWEGVARPAVLEGSIGADARAIGGALLPLYANFTPADREVFLKLEV